MSAISSSWASTSRILYIGQTLDILPRNCVNFHLAPKTALRRTKNLGRLFWGKADSFAQNGYRLGLSQLYRSAPGAVNLCNCLKVVNPLGIKGVGEIGVVGVAAAIANAVYHTTGKRVRDLPITLDKLQR